MTSRICFLDCETTSLRPDRRAWEVGLIVRRDVIVKHPDGPDTDGTEDVEHRWLIAADDLDLGNADPMALKIGRFYERHPDFTPIRKAGVSGAWEAVYPEPYVLREVEKLTRGAHIVGAVPNFDTEVLAARMREHGICPSWHYHLVDIEALAVGYLSGLRSDEPPGMNDYPLSLPWKSDDLSAALGIQVSEDDRHTALGDARWAMAIYDAVTGHA